MKAYQYLLSKLKYNKYHLFALGYIAILSHPFYWFWWTYVCPNPYENITLRIIGAISCAVLLFMVYKENLFKKILPLYWLFVVVYNLPFFFTVNLIKNNLVDVWLMSEIVMIFVVILFIPNIFSALLAIFIGVIGAVIFSITTNQINIYPINLLLSHSIIYGLALTAGYIFNRSNVMGIEAQQKSKYLEDKAASLKSLAGSIAHELRNPLNAINLARNQSQELLLESSPQDINQTIKQQLTDLNSSINSSVTEANNTINIILSDLSNKPIEASDFSYLSADKILPKIIKTFGYRSLEEKEKVKLNVKDNFIFKAIDDRFTFIVYNLLKNALYYLNQYPNSIVTVGAETRSVDNKEYNFIYVHDTGPGIAAHILPKLFGDFFTSGKKDGTGLGLAFCKRNMQIFDGDIIVESEIAVEEKNGWTKFSLLFPKLTEEEIVRAKTEAKKRKILLVDNQQANLLTTKSRIEQNLANIICDTAISGKEAITMAKENKYSLILMDIQMPEMNGIEATKNIRKFNKEIPIIAYTSLDQNLEEIKSVTNDLIKKPVADNILFRTITKWLVGWNDEFSYLGSKEEYKSILQNKNILLADDQEMNLIMTKGILKRNGLTVTTVKDGRELLETYHSNPNSFDLIITDINMSSYNGDEAAKTIRTTNQHIPIIALSGDGEKKDIYHFFACGMTDYFIKGSNPELLIKIVANYLIEKKG